MFFDLVNCLLFFDLIVILLAFISWILFQFLIVLICIDVMNDKSRHSTISAFGGILECKYLFIDAATIVLDNFTSFTILNEYHYIKLALLRYLYGLSNQSTLSLTFKIGPLGFIFDLVVFPKLYCFFSRHFCFYKGFLI